MDTNKKCTEEKSKNNEELLANKDEQKVRKEVKSKATGRKWTPPATDHYKFFQNRECEYFPCHKTENLDDFNCLYCFCPLYMLKDKCGGNWKMTNGVKDCSDCLIPHRRNSYDYMMTKMDEIIKKGSDF